MTARKTSIPVGLPTLFPVERKSVVDFACLRPLGGETSFTAMECLHVLHDACLLAPLSQKFFAFSLTLKSTVFGPAVTAEQQNLPPAVLIEDHSRLNLSRCGILFTHYIQNLKFRSK